MAYDYKKNNPYEEDEQNGVRNNKVSTPNYTYGDTGGASNAQRYTGEGVSGGGTFKYNSALNTNKLGDTNMLFGSSAEQYESQNPGYLEKRNNAIANALYNEGKTDRASVENYLNTFSGYSNYDKVGQKNTVDAIMNRIGSNMNQQGNNGNNGYTNNANTMNAGMMNDMGTNFNNYKNGYSNLMGGSSNYASNFDEAVLNKLKTAYGIESLDEFKQRYPEQYDSLMQSLETVRPVRDATNPTQRQMLDGQLQGIIGTGVGAGSDWSKLNVLESSIMNKFENPEQIKQDAQNILKLQTEGRSIPEIAERMGMSEDQVQQLVLLANGLDSKAGEYYKLNDKSAKDITEPYDKKLERARIEKDIALERANRQVEWLKQDFDTNMERQQKANEVNLHNADFLSGQYGYGFSKRGIEGLQYTAQQAQNIIDDLCKNYDRNNQQLADGIADIIRNWERYNEDITEASEEALTQAKNNYTSNMLAIQQQYGTVGMQAQQQLSNNVQSFITSAESIYDNMLQQQQQNLTNLITNAGNLNALSMQNLTLRQAKIQQFQNESLNLNRNQLQNLADQLGMDKETYQDLVNYQVQAVANQLNGYVPGAGVQMQQQIQSLLDQGYSPNQAMQSIMNSADFKALQSAGGGNGEWKITGDYMYNSATGEWQNLAGGGMGGDTNYVTSQTIDGQTYGVSQQTMQGLQNFYNNHQVGSQGGQCGAFVNDYLQSLGIGRIFTDPIDKKKAQINTPQGYTPQVGDVVVMDSPYEKTKKYGHVAIVTGVDGNKITTLESNKAGEGKVFTRTIDTSKTKVHGYYHPDGVSAGGQGGDAIGNMSEYDKISAIANITKMAFGGNASDRDAQRVEDMINLGDSMGKTENEIAYNLVGWKNIKPEYQGIADNLADVMKKSVDGMAGFDCRGIVDLINKGDIPGAIQKIENTMMENDAKAGKSTLGVSTDSDARHLLNSIQKIRDNINSYSQKNSAFGWADATMNYINTAMFGVGDKGRKLYNETKSDFANLFNEYRNSVFGSALTETEIKESRKQLPTMSDKLSEVETKFNSFSESILSQVNSRRTQLGLPKLTMEQLLDPSLRVDLYYGNNQTQGRGNGDLGGGGSMSGGGGRG